MEITDDELRELADSGKVELGGGYTLRLRTEPDENTTINDFDCYGKVEWTKNNPYNGGSVRPEHFTGRAEKLESDRRNTLWWEPPVFDDADARRWHTDREYRNSVRDAVLSVVRDGFVVLVAELCHGTDAYGKDIVADFACLGGVEPECSDDLGYLGDLVFQLNMPASV